MCMGQIEHLHFFLKYQKNQSCMLSNEQWNISQYGGEIFYFFILRNRRKEGEPHPFSFETKYSL